MVGLGAGLGAPGFHELSPGVVRHDELLARYLAIALGGEKVAAIDTPGRMREQGCGRSPPGCDDRALNILKRVRANFLGGQRFQRFPQKIFLRRGCFWGTFRTVNAAIA